MQIRFIIRTDYNIDFKSVSTKRFVIIYNVTVIFTFPFFFFYPAVVFFNNIFQPAYNIFINVFYFHTTVFTAVPGIFSEHNNTPKSIYKNCTCFGMLNNPPKVYYKIVKIGNFLFIKITYKTYHKILKSSYQKFG